VMCMVIIQTMKKINAKALKEDPKNQ